MSSAARERPSHLRGAVVWLAWVAAGVVGAAVGLAVAVPALALAAPGVLLGGFVLGACVGAPQAAVLAWALPGLSRRWWTGATTAVTVAGWFAAARLGAGAGSAAEPDPQFQLLFGVGLGLAMGLALGIAQWLVLRAATRRAWAWIPVSAIAWTVGMVPAFAGAASLAHHSALPAAAAVGAGSGAALGLLLGAITGFAVAHLHPREGAG